MTTRPTTDLSALKPVRALRGSVTLLCGRKGVGKSTLAGRWPGQMVAHALEPGSELLGEQVQAFPRAVTTEDVYQDLRSLGSQQHGFRSYGLDTLNALMHRERDRVTMNTPGMHLGVAEGGFEKGFIAVADELARLAKAFHALSRAKGMHIVITCHLDRRRVERPGRPSHEEYYVRGLAKTQARLGSEAEPFVEMADVVCVLERSEQQVVDAGNGKLVHQAGSGWVLDMSSVEGLTATRLPGMPGRIEWDGRGFPFAEWIK